MLISGFTKIVGVFGNPISHSASPRMHNRMYAEQGIDFVFVPLLVDPSEIGNAVKSIRALNFAGVNVTIPFKETVIPHLDAVSSFAERVGAVNTIVNENGSLVGYNTDGEGFLYALKEDGQFDPKNKRVVILGAGGSSKSIAHVLLDAGVNQLAVWNRTLQRSQALVSNLSAQNSGNVVCLTDDSLQEAISSCDLLINTTSVGMAPEINALPISSLAAIGAHHFVYDVIYTPAETALLREARQLGAKTLNGLGMLAAQGMLAYTRFTGKEASFDFMKSAIGEDL
ncbi:MAG: shikimate dehydrogenase [Candidatus Marinamargulisbacteria bacterium]|jgi:shikimate dehydrogenase